MATRLTTLTASTVATDGDAVATERDIEFTCPLLSGAVLVSALVPADEDLHARSDRFWLAPYVLAMSAESFGSLSEIAVSADSVIVARVQAVVEGRAWDPNGGEPGLEIKRGDPITPLARFAELYLEVERAIGASIYPVGSTIRLEVFLPHDGVLDEMIANRPSERAVYFLRNKGESDSTDYYRLVNDYQAVFRELAGRVHAPVAAEGEWVAELEGRNFEEMIEELSKVRP